MKLADRTYEVTPSYTIGINMKVAEMAAEGKRMLNLSIGEPDFYVPEKAKQAASDALTKNNTRYDKASGLLPLREAIVEKLQSENGVSYEPDQIVVSNGAKQAIMNALLALIDHGDEILVPVPYWTSYPEIIRLCGGVPVIFEPEDKVTYKVKASDLEKVVTEKTKMFFFNNPSNPSGVIYKKEEMKELADFCLNNSIWVLSDEIYERFSYENEFVSFPSLSEEIKNNTILVNGFSKSFAMTGLRVGYTASPKEVSAAISKMQGHLTSHPSIISQWVACVALTDCREEMNIQQEIFSSRRKIMMMKLNMMKNISYMSPDGAFYIMMDISAYKGKLDYEGSFSVAFCEKLLDEYQVAVVPGIAFGLDDYVRIAYIQQPKELMEGMDKIDKFLAGL